MNRAMPWSTVTLGALRIMTGLLFMQHGAQKLFHFPDAGHNPGPIEIISMVGIAGLLELIGGALVAVGFYTRAAAFILSGEMAVAYFAVHFPAGLAMPMGFFPAVNQGDLAILFCFVFLHFACAGPGRFSVDGALHKQASGAGGTSALP